MDKITVSTPMPGVVRLSATHPTLPGVEREQAHI